MDVNEKIISTWLTHHKYFVMDNIYFGQFHQDIDLLAVNLSSKELLDIEVKVRTGSTKISDNDNKQNGFKHFVGQLNSQERGNKIKEIIGDLNGFRIRKLFITTRSLLGKVNNKIWIDRFLQEGIEVKFIEEIISELEELAKGLSLSKNEVIQILRLQNIRNIHR
jgi:hypothetical protein